MNEVPKICLVVPCYNEAEVLPVTGKLFSEKLQGLIACRKVRGDSIVLLVDDGSMDDTWGCIQRLAKESCHVKGISLSRNRGHQNALLAGLMEARGLADVIISADCDGQDDINCMDAMLAEYAKGFDVVYACRDDRSTDTWFKRCSAETFYKLMRWLGCEIVFNHADYRLTSARVLDALAEFSEVNLFLRGLFPLVGYKSSKVYYSRKARMLGESHYPFFKMFEFALNGVTSLSVKPLRLITVLGVILSLGSLVILALFVCILLRGGCVRDAGLVCSGVALFCGFQLVSLGIVGEYIGKIYLESKHRPRYIVAEKCGL